MSDRLSHLRKGILALLTGEMQTRMISPRSTFTTLDMLVELRGRGWVSARKPEDLALRLVENSCIALMNLGFVDLQYKPTGTCSPGEGTACWTATLAATSEVYLSKAVQFQHRSDALGGQTDNAPHTTR